MPLLPEQCACTQLALPTMSAGPANRQRIRQSTGARVTATIDQSNTNPKGIRASRMTPLIAPTRAAAESTFAEIGVRDEIVQALTEEGIEHPFAIQELTLPLALAGDDLIGQARTGMGKTFAFGVPLLQRITTSGAERPLTGIPRALIVVPTRELCLQVSGDLATAAKYLSTDDGRRCRWCPSTAAGPTSRRSRRCARASTWSSAPPAGCSTWPSRGTWNSAVSDAGPRRGRRDARPGLPARRRADPAPDPRPAADHAVLGDHAGPDHHAGPHVHEPADAHPRRGADSSAVHDATDAVRLPGARDGQGRTARPDAAGRGPRR